MLFRKCQGHPLFLTLICREVSVLGNERFPVFCCRGYREVKVEVALSIGAIGSAVGQDMQR